MGEILISKEGEALPPTPAEQALTPQPVIGLGEQPATVTVPATDARASLPTTQKFQADRESYQEIQEALAVMGELLEQDVEEEEEEEEAPAKPMRVLSKEEIQAGSSQEATPVVSSQPAPQPPAGTQQPGKPKSNRNGLVRFLIGSHRPQRKS